MTNSWPISWWDWTGDYTPFIDNVSSPYLRNIVTGQIRVLGGIRMPDGSRMNGLPWGACYVANKDVKTGEIDRDDTWVGADGLSIVCVTPRTNPPDLNNPGQWYIDSRANNCTMKEDWVHRCWVRRGTFGDPFHIDKDGLTCSAGAGSIQNAGWHGFLHNGVLHE